MARTKFFGIFQALAKAFESFFPGSGNDISSGMEIPGFIVVKIRLTRI